MWKLLSILALLATAHTLPIEQNDDVAIPAAENDRSNLNPDSDKPDDQFIDREPKPIDSEASTHRLEPEKQHSDSDIEGTLLSSVNLDHGYQEKPVLSEPIVSEPIVSEPVLPGPIAPEPIRPEPIASESVVPEPIASEPIVSRPIVSEPVISEPISSEPVVPGPVESEPIISEPIVSEPVIPGPIASEPIISEPIVSEPAIPEPFDPEPIHPEPIGGTSPVEFHKPEEPIVNKPEQPIGDISKPEETKPIVIPGNQEVDDEKDLEAAIDEFFSFLNLTDSEEMEDVVLASILVELFEGLDEVLTALEQMEELTGQKEEAEVLRKHINDPYLRSAFEKKPPKPPASVLKQKNEANEDDSPAVACKAEGLPGICVPYYLCATTNAHSENDVHIDLDYSSCPTVTEICCASENLQLGTGAGLRKW